MIQRRYEEVGREGGGGGDEMGWRRKRRRRRDGMGRSEQIEG
jgi:hypothetical protein